MNKNSPGSFINKRTASTLSDPDQTPLIINNAFDDFAREQYLASGYTTTDDVRPTFSGRGPADEIITLYSGETILGSTTIDLAGRWELDIDIDLISGANQVVARTASQESNVFEVIVELAADVPLTILGGFDEFGDHSIFENEGVTDDTLPLIYGRAGALEIVTLFDSEGNVLGSTQANDYGIWNIEVSEEMSIGSHTLTAKTATQESNSFSFSIELSVSEPEPQPEPIDVPVTIAYAYDNVGQTQYLNDGSGRTDDTRPTFFGRAGANQIVTLFAGETELGSIQADANGDWSLEITHELASGANAVIARTETNVSNPFTVIVAFPVDEPVLIQYAYDNVGEEQRLYNGFGSTDDSRPAFRGIAGANQIITLYAGEEVLGSTQADIYGSWSLEITTDLTNGINVVTARTATQISNEFVINVELPNPVTIDYAYDNVGQHQYLNNGYGKTDDTRPTFFGRAGANQIVTLYSGSNVLGSAKADGNGNWSLEIANELTSGINTVIAHTETHVSNSFSVTVETTADVPVTIDYAYDNVAQHQYLYNRSTVKTDDARPTFYGRAGAGQIVTLYSGENVLGSVRADNDGQWTLEISRDLSSGIHDIFARTTTQASNAFLVNVELPGDVPVTINYAFDNVGHQHYLSSGLAKTDDTRPEFFGRAGAGQLITLYADQTVLGSVHADSFGYWSLEITTDLIVGLNSVIARTETRESDIFMVNVELPAPVDTPVTIEFAYDNIGNQQYLSNGYGKTDDTRPTFTGSAGAGQIVTLYAGETVLGSVRTDDFGRWSLEIIADLASGANAVIARTETRDSRPFNINIETAADAPVTIDYAYDNVGLEQQYLFGRLAVKTDDARPTFLGTAGANQLVTLYAGEEVLGSVRADEHGRWTLEINIDLSSGVNVVTARTEKRTSVGFVVNVETAADMPVTIEYAHDNIDQQQLHNGMGETDDVRPEFFGRAGAGEIVTLYAGETLLGSVRTDDWGNWSFEIEADLVAGSNTIVAKTPTQQSSEFVVIVPSQPTQPEIPGNPDPIEPVLPIDPTPIQTPVITQVTDVRFDHQIENGGTSIYSPAFSGVAAPFAEVVLIFNRPGGFPSSLIIETVLADENGEWTSSRSLPDRVASTFEVRAYVNGEYSEPFTVRIDPSYSYPAENPVEVVADVGTPVTIATAHDNVNSEQYLGNNRGITDDTRPTFYGMAGANQIVTLYSGERVLGSVQANGQGEWFVEITQDLTSGSNDIVAKTANSQSEGFIVNVISAVTPVTLNVNLADQEGAVGNGDTISVIPTISGTAAAFAAVDLTYTTELGTIHSRIYADEEGKWQQTPDFLPIDRILTTQFEIEAISGGSTSDKFVVNISPLSNNMMTDILIDNGFSLFNDIPQVSVEEELVLAISDADMLYQSEGLMNQAMQNSSSAAVYQEEPNYLVAVI